MKVDLIPFTNGNFPVRCILHSLFKIPEELMALFSSLGYLSFPEMPTGFLVLDLVSRSALFSKHPSSRSLAHQVLPLNLLPWDHFLPSSCMPNQISVRTLTDRQLSTLESYFGSTKKVAVIWKTQRFSFLRSSKR